MIIVALEGPDASGKDTMQHSISVVLRRQGTEVHDFRTPGGGSEALRKEALSGEYPYHARRAIMAADVAMFCRRNLHPLMNSGRRGVILVNRYWYSDVVYSHADRMARYRAKGLCPLPGSESHSLSEQIYREYGFETPALVIRMAPTFDVCWSRMMAKSQDGLERTYDRRFFRDVYLAYEDLDYSPAPVLVYSEVNHFTVRSAVSRINMLVSDEES